LISMASGVPLGFAPVACAEAGAATRGCVDRYEQRLRITNERNTVLFIMM